MAAWLLPGSTAAWFVVLNAVVCAIAFLSSRARESLSPRLAGAGVARRASSAALQRLRSSFSIFSFPSATFPAFHPDAAQAAGRRAGNDNLAAVRRRARDGHAIGAEAGEEDYEEEEEEEVEEENAMSMEEAYALVMAARGRPEPTEEETSTAEVDAKAEEYIDEQRRRRRRLDSIFNYTQMLKQRAAAGHRQQPAPAAQL